MLTQHQCPVSLLHLSSNLPVYSEVATVATIYQKDLQFFHVVLATPPDFSDSLAPLEANVATLIDTTPRLLWLELSPSRVTMTIQGNSNFSYRHTWERGIYGISRYWLADSPTAQSGQFCLSNYTRSLVVQGSPLPQFVRVEYELWANQVRLGNYILNLEIFI